MTKYNKFLVAIAGAVVAGLFAYFGSDVPAWVNTLVAVLTALGVYGVPNKV